LVFDVEKRVSRSEKGTADGFGEKWKQELPGNLGSFVSVWNRIFPGNGRALDRRSAGCRRGS
jgi:hypothetical protein